jgi:M26 IgA1-specific Metallo-endopeptidase N-terminal region
MPHFGYTLRIALVIVAVSLTLTAGIAGPARPRVACTPITNVNQLQAMRNNLAGNYCLANDIDASTKRNFAPVGSTTTPFTGRLNGAGYVIRNLTIRSAQSRVGLFGVASGAVVNNLTLQHVDVKGITNNALVGGLAGVAYADAPGSTTIANVRVSGRVICTGDSCDVGGLVGGFGSFTGAHTIRNSSSSADVTGTRFIGGVVGLLDHSRISRSYATGAVLCTQESCMAGGLVGRSQSSAVDRSFATGPVAAKPSVQSRVGGLIGLCETTSTIARSYATGPVSGSVTIYAGGLVGQLNCPNVNPAVDQTYAVGLVSSSGATTGGLIANAGGGPVITNSYWDTDTTGQATSAGGTGQTTAQLRAALPSGFDNTEWGITPNLSYPFLIDPGIDFASPLATLVRSNRVFTFLPISQFDESQYSMPPAGSNLTALATVYTMIGRAIGLTRGVPQLDHVAIDRYFWDEATQKARWRGPVKNYATLGAIAAISSGTPIEVANVLGVMDAEQLVILLGTYRQRGGVRVRHWMLGTLYTKDSGGTPNAVIAHDPYTGQQVTIGLTTKKVVSPANFPLTNFTVNAYQPVSVN